MNSQEFKCVYFFKEKSKLTSEHSEMQTFKKKFAEIEEEREQMAGLATQELAKVKHLVGLENCVPVLNRAVIKYSITR